MVLPNSPSAEEVQEQASTNYLLFHLGNELYAVQSKYVGEIARWHEPLSVPGLPSTLPGIINHRGVVLTVVDMRVLVGFPDVPPNRVTRYIIVHHDDMNMALLVDSVADIINLFDDALEAVPAALDPQKSRLLQAIVRLDDRPVALIDLSAVTNTLLSGA